MKVTLISYTQPVEGLTANSLTELVAYCARVSNPSNQNNTETSEKLIEYLVKHSHWSPMEMVNICLEIQTTRDIARQILRHRSFTFQEFSQRYADPTKNLNFVTRQARWQDFKNRQNSIECNDTELQRDWTNLQKTLTQVAMDTYTWAVEHGIAKEQARAVLPEGLMESKLYCNGTLRSWIHYIQLRSGKETQKEHRAVARKCAQIIEPIFPMITNFVQQEN